MIDNLKEGMVFVINDDLKIRIIKKDKHMFGVTYIVQGNDIDENKIWPEDELLDLVNSRMMELDIPTMKLEIFKQEVARIIK